uniref:Retrotransposon Copia-like N-terminal domain-containing protein n=1 Tax=Chenopodium quinoa TaxID=63459 RepID=A0A803M5N9_CHEQI
MPENEVPDAQMNYQDLLFLSHSDNHAASLTPMLFDGSNFMIWSRNVKLALGAKNKKGFIEGKIPKPAAGHKDYSRWERNDYMTSNQLWDELVERYLDSNIPLLYQLKKDLGKLEQGEMCMGEYYCKLKKFWDEIYNIEAIPECTCGIVAKCTCSMGYQNIRENILGMDPLPSVNKAFHMVQQTEKQKKVTGEMQELGESSAFQVQKEAKKTAVNVGKLEDEMDSPLDEEEFEAGNSSSSRPDSQMISAMVKEDHTNGESLAFGRITNDLYKFCLKKEQREASDTMKTIRSDNGTEIVQSECSNMFAKKGIAHQTSIAGVPQQNGRALRIHAGDDEEYIETLKQELNTQFTIKDLGEMRYFMGLEVSKFSKGTLLNQRKFILDVLEFAGLSDYKPVTAPFSKHVKLSTQEGEIIPDP